jgi:hypothetical protein
MIISTILKQAYEHRGKILIATMIILIIIFLKQCDNQKYKDQKSAQNEDFYKEEIKKKDLKNGEHEYQKAILVSSINNLKNDTSRLARETIALSKEKTKPEVVIVTKIEYRDRGSVDNTITQLDTNKYSIDFLFRSDDKILSIKGRNIFYASAYDKLDKSIGLKLKSDKTFLDSININLDLTLGIKKDKDNIDRIFAKTNSDKVIIGQLDATEIEEYYKKKNNTKPKRFGIGPFIGAGMTISQTGYRMGPTIGIGLQYNLIRF